MGDLIPGGSETTAMTQTPKKLVPLPDADIYPNATGAALETTKERTAPQDLTFYAGMSCTLLHAQSGSS